MNPEQLQAAYLLWLYKHYGSAQTDQDIVPFLDKEMGGFVCGESWLKKARIALLLSTETVAEKLSVSRSSYAKLEKSEMKGSICLSSMAKAAKAMDCELVYAIRPKKKVRFSSLIWQILLKSSEKHHWVVSRPQAKKANALATIAQQKMNEAEFRRYQGWSERKITKECP